MTDNLYNFKKRIRPQDYENGPVKIYTKEEIDRQINRIEIEIDNLRRGVR